MSKTLDFNKLKKKFMTVTLADENNTVLMINTPTKAIMDGFLAMRDSLSEDMENDALDELYDIVARIMSHNRNGKKFTKEEVQELFDYEDIIIFIRAYTEFINEVIDAKN